MTFSKSSSPCAANDQKIRVLHIFKRMDRGGAETWIVNVLKEIDRSRFQFDFFVEPGEAGQYDKQIRELGGQIIRGPSTSNPLVYSLALYRLLRQGQPYDVVHSHVHHFSGLTLAIAKAARVPIRIAHSHNDLRRSESSEGIGRRLYRATMKRSIRLCATKGFAVSKDSARSLFGSRWDQDERLSVLHCGIELKSFETHFQAESARAQLGIPHNAFVIGHVGSFTRQKNHQFIIDVFAEVVQERPDAYLLLIGSGPKELEVRQQIESLGLGKRVVLAGLRSDVPQLMKGVMDAFFLPSLHEGIPLVLMEAQAAGLQSVVSDTITQEAIVIPELFHFLSLSASKSEWAKALTSLTGTKRNTLPIMASSTFNVRHSADALANTYQQCAG